MSNKSFPSDQHMLNARVFCFLDGFRMETVDVSASWYQQGKVVQSDKQHAIVLEDGYRVQYRIEQKKRNNIKNDVHSLLWFEKHARTIRGARYVNYYHKTTRVFSHRQNLI
jgi:hypothetical protein